MNYAELIEEYWYYLITVSTVGAFIFQAAMKKSCEEEIWDSLSFLAKTGALLISIGTSILTVFFATALHYDLITSNLFGQIIALLVGTYTGIYFMLGCLGGVHLATDPKE